MKARWRLASLVLLFGLFATMTFVALRNPARRSPEAIRADLLSQAPPGTPLAEVEGLIREKGMDQGKCWAADPDGTVRCLMVQYGRVQRFRHFPWPGTVEAHWHFDRQGGLTDVSIHRFPE